MSTKPLKTLKFRGMNTVYEIPDAVEIDKHFEDKNNPHSVTAAQVGAATAADLSSHTNNKNNPHGVTAAQIGAATVISGWCELPHTGWSRSAPYTQTINVAGILASDTPIVDVKIWDGDDSTTILSHMDGWSCVDNIVAGDGKLTVYCYEEKPSVWVSFKYIIVR